LTIQKKKERKSFSLKYFKLECLRLGRIGELKKSSSHAAFFYWCGIILNKKMKCARII